MVKKTKMTMLVLFALTLIAASPFVRQLVPTAGSKISVPPGAFIPTYNGMPYSSGGNWLRGLGNFTAPVYLPGSKTVTQIKLYAVDDSVGDVCAYLYRTSPADPSEVLMAGVCSTGDQPGVREFTTTNINPDQVSPSNGLYIWVSATENSADLLLYGVKIFYEN